MGIALQQIIDVDEKNQQIISNLWMTVRWTDPTLAWNKSEYGGLDKIRVLPDMIWRPDILVYNSAAPKFDPTFHTKVTVTSEGLCEWIPPGIFKTSCPIDVTYFPFDIQECEIKFGSWTYGGFTVDLELLSDEVAMNDTSEFVKNGEWNLIGMPAEKKIKNYTCCPETYPSLHFYITIRRRALYYTLNILVPCLVISSLALVGFTLPVESGEKLSFGITILLSLTVFMLLVAEAMPATSVSVPLIAKYFDCVLMMVAVSVVFTVITLNIHYRHPNSHVMASWQRSLLLEWLPWLLYMKRPGREWSPCQPKPSRDDMGPPVFSHVGPSTEIQLMDRSPKRKVGTNGMVPQGTYLNDAKTIGIKYANYAHEESEPMMLDHKACKEGNSRELDLIIREVRFLTERYKLKDMEDDEIHDWKFAAMVIDRFAMVFLTIFTVVATVVILSDHP
ncbi:neuronal acetylcholine receptor subunit alpha-7 isoform X1 [Strongylocentrotus purpuratus]|uniref:Neuronal acetylcholine receptor subunit alpha-7 n=1 Tax=Strongylocentrotus purpuratus TaxID=7668 RepID=A0A7M7HJL6_STRPU|nr:neuronal acetylcholine receptor subunit alpha-7 isoform X1 [Strongylocentrotus purpuratus]|eukprot:XP_011674149.1 PREDICTED: neuronal acetylcholine receptor subunit alpha-7 isoform X1 [Strongylocentrotus purpuratus]